MSVPKATNTWKKDGKTIDIKERISVDGDGSLVIQKVKPADQGNYTYTASILQRRKEQVIKIEVKVFGEFDGM